MLKQYQLNLNEVKKAIGFFLKKTNPEIPDWAYNSITISALNSHGVSIQCSESENLNAIISWYEEIPEQENDSSTSDAGPIS